MAMTWIFLLIFGFLLFVVLLLAVPLGLIALAVSPEVQRGTRRALTVIGPLALVGVGLLTILGFKTTRVEPGGGATLVQQATAHPVQEESVESAFATVTEQPEAVAISLSPDVAEPGDGAVAPEVSGDPQTPVTITQFIGETTPGQPATELPNWVDADPQIDLDADSERFVLRSGRYSSVAEGEAELLGDLRPRLASYLQRGGDSIDVAAITLDDLRRSHVRTARVVEQFDIVLKSSIEPVYRVSWQVTLRPVVRDALGADYRLASRDERLWQLGLGTGLLTLLFGTWAAYFRIDDSTQGRYRGRLQLAAVGASLSGLAALFIA